MYAPSPPTPERRPFGLDETHGILKQAGQTIFAHSGGMGWSSLYASTQREKPYEAKFSAVRDHLIVLHLDGPVGVRRMLGRREDRRLIAPGGLFVLPGGHDFGVCLEGELESVHIYLRHDLVLEVAETMGLAGDRIDIQPRLGERDLLAERLALGVRDVLREGDPAAAAYADYLSQALAARLLRMGSAPPASAQTAGSRRLTKFQLATVSDFIEAHLGRPLTVRQMAAVCGLEPAAFARRFKASVGRAPHQYLMAMRVERAERLLSGPSAIADIALDCGFAHQEHLTRVFRRSKGVTPARFRRLSRN